MAPVAGPVNVLVQGSFKTVDDIEILSLQESLGEKSEAEGFQERRAGDQGDSVKYRPSLPIRPLSLSLRFPSMGEEMNVMAQLGEPFHELAQVAFGSSIGGIGFANEGDLHKYSVSGSVSEKIPMIAVSVLVSVSVGKSLFFFVSSLTLTLTLFASYIFPEIRLYRWPRVGRE
jgi:hypothetical protein